MNKLENVNYAGFWIRSLASILDSILFTLIALPPLIGIYGSDYYGHEFWTSDVWFQGIWNFWITSVLPFFATVVFWVCKSATPGKMITRIEVINARTGEKLSLGQSIGRYLGYFISMIPLMAGCLWIAFDKKKQGWHDKIAGTAVVYVKAQEENE